MPKSKIALSVLPLCTAWKGDQAHLLHPGLFVLHNVRVPYFRNQLHLRERIEVVSFLGLDMY
jgi:3-polyprenyl-4-hydroxybenzoate decarboxylase